MTCYSECMTEALIEPLCKAVTPSACSYHSKREELVAAVARSMKAEDYDSYFLHRKELEALDFTIMVEENGDFTALESRFGQTLTDNRKQSAAIAHQLRKIHRTGDYSRTTWTMFSKLAVQHLAAQSYGATLEKMYLTKLGLTKVSSSAERGDFVNPATNHYSEFKVTAADELTGRAVNVVQIRPHHDIHDYHIVIVDKNTGDSELFVLTKEQMKQEVLLTGSSLAHGSKKTNTYLNKEYAIRFQAVAGDVVYDRWKLTYSKPFPIV